MPRKEYRGLSLHKELVATIENYVETHPEMGYRSLSDFATDALREKCEKLGIFIPKPEPPILEHFNLGEGGVRILARKWRNKLHTLKRSIKSPLIFLAYLKCVAVLKLYLSCLLHFLEEILLAF